LRQAEWPLRVAVPVARYRRWGRGLELPQCPATGVMHLDLNDEEQRLFIRLGGIIVIATGILIAGQVFRLRIGRNQMRCNAAAGLAIVLVLCGCQSGTQLPPTPVIGATCQTLSGSCLLLTPPPSGGGCTCSGLGDGIVTGASGP